MDGDVDQTGSERSIDGGGDRGGDREWWLALRRTVLRVLELAESAAAGDAQFRSDLNRLLGRDEVQELGGLGAESREPIAATPAGVEGESATAAAAEAAGAKTEEAAPQSPPVPRVAPVPAPQQLIPRPAALVGPRVVGGPPAPAAQYPRKWTQRAFEPARVALSCRLKAEACRWQSQRSRKLDEGEDVSGGDRELVTRAASHDVWLWMVSPNRWRERSEEAFATVGGCYDALADAAELIELSERLGVQQQASLRLLAEAQSSVRAAVEDYASSKRDEDQESTFAWLRQETESRRVYVEHMQLDRLAPPDNHADLRVRIAALRQELDAKSRRGQSVESTIRKIAYHAKKITQRDGAAGGEALDAGDSDVTKIAESAAYLEGEGVPPSDVRVREALLPIFDRLAGIGAERLESSSPALYRIMEAVDEYRDQVEANRAVEEERGGDGDEAADELVGRAKELVAGRDAVLIGGQPSEPHRLRLERGLGLSSLDWLRVGHHESFESASNAIARPGMGLVMIMTRWRSHRDGPAARELCRRLGVPLVELPAGYNLRQVAHRIVEQMGG